MERKVKICVFGNPLLDFDSLPLKLVPELQKEFPEINFVVLDPNENLKPENKELIIIDTVKNIEEVKVLNDLSKLETAKIFSAHDLDLSFNLKILQKIGKLNKVIIFGIPPEIKKQEAKKQLTRLIKKYVQFKSN